MRHRLSVYDVALLTSRFDKPSKTEHFGLYFIKDQTTAEQISWILKLRPIVALSLKINHVSITTRTNKCGLCC